MESWTWTYSPPRSRLRSFHAQGCKILPQYFLWSLSLVIGNTLISQNLETSKFWSRKIFRHCIISLKLQAGSSHNHKTLCCLCCRFRPWQKIQHKTILYWKREYNFHPVTSLCFQLGQVRSYISFDCHKPHWLRSWRDDWFLCRGFSWRKKKLFIPFLSN